MKKRSLDAIAGDIHAQERGSIFDIGALLIEAREQCEYGQWMAWVSQEFAWSHDTAENYTKAAELAARFRTVRNLKLTARTINRIARHKDTD